VSSKTKVYNQSVLLSERKQNNNTIFFVTFHEFDASGSVLKCGSQDFTEVNCLKHIVDILTTDNETSRYTHHVISKYDKHGSPYSLKRWAQPELKCTLSSLVH
jgi:hypothetical protein